jgi:hypothetical protein
MEELGSHGVMIDCLNTLPWRLASLAALIVGGVSIATGATDVWTGLERVGIAFVAFYVIGAVAKMLLVVSTTHSAGRHPSGADAAGGRDGRTNL